MWLTGPVAPRHVGSSQTRARTRVPCIGRQILNHCATREAPVHVFLLPSTFPLYGFTVICYLVHLLTNICVPFLRRKFSLLLGEYLEVEWLDNMVGEHLTEKIYIYIYLFLKNLFIYFIFGCVGSLLLHVGFLVAVSRGYSSLRCTGFSLWWLLLLQSMGSRRAGLVPRHVGSSRAGDRTCVPCIGRRILTHCTTREVPRIILDLHRSYCDSTESSCVSGSANFSCKGPGSKYFKLCGQVVFLGTAQFCQCKAEVAIGGL